MTENNIEKFNTLYNITKDEKSKSINVEVGFVHWDGDVKCICDAIEYLATNGKGNKSITIQSFNLRGITISAGESPVEVYNRIREQYGKGWYWDPMPEDIAAAQKKFEERIKESQSAGSEPGERE